MNASVSPSSPGAGDVLLSALAYVKAEAAAAAPQLPAEFLDLTDQLPVVRPRDSGSRAIRGLSQETPLKRARGQVSNLNP